MIARLKNINRIVSKGKVYYYHRPTKKRIQAAYGTAAFIAEVTRLNAALEEAKPAPDTLGALMAAYRAAPEFTERAERTRADYQKVMDWLKAIDDTSLVDITPAFAIEVRDKAFRLKKRRFANYVVTFGGLLFKWAIPRGLATSNPFEPVPHVRKAHGTPKANRAWTQAEIAAVIDAAPPGMRAAVALGAYAGIREGDVLKLPWSALKDGIITYRQGKTGEVVDVLAHSRLAEILSDTPQLCPIIVTGQRGKPMTANGFLSNLRKILSKLKAEGKIGDGLTFHGLRHTAATMLADAGCDTRDIMAVTGHRTEAVVAIYTQEADRRRRGGNAIKRLEKAQSRNTKCKTKPGKLQNPT